MTLLKKLAIFLLRVHRSPIRRAHLVLLITLAVIAVSLIGITRIRTIYAIHDIEDPSLRVAEDLRLTKREFALGNAVFVIFKPNHGASFSHEEILKIRRWTARETLSNPHLLTVHSPFELREAQAAENRLWYMPTIEANVPEEIARLAHSPWSGIFTDRSGRDLAVEFVFADNEDSQFYGSFDPSPVGRLLESLKENFEGSISYVVSGEAVFQYFAHEGITRNHLLNVVLLTFLLIGFRLLFGTWRSGLVFFGTLLLMATVTFGTMGWFDVPIDLISSGLFLMLAVAGLEDFLFLCHEQVRLGTNSRKAMRMMLVASFFTSLTTFLGFGSLLTIDMLVMKRFGTWAAFGVAVEWLATFVVLPAAIMKFPSLGTFANPRKAFLPGVPDAILRAHLSPRVARGLLAVFALGAFALFHLNISGASKDMMPESHPFIVGMKELQVSRGWEGTVHLIFNDAGQVSANREILERLRRHANVAQVLEPEMIAAHVSRHVPAEYGDLVRRDLRKVPGFQSFFGHSQGSRATLYVKDTDTAPMMDLLAKAKAECNDACYATSEAAAHAEFSERVPTAFIDSFLSSFLLVSLVLAFLVRYLTRPPRPYLAVIASSMWGPFAILVLFWAFNVKINFMACLFMTVLIGLTGDNAIQFLFAARKTGLAAGLARRGGGSLLIGLFIALSCLVFVGSYFVSPRIYGAFLAIGILGATFGDIWLLKGLAHFRSLKK